MTIAFPASDNQSDAPTRDTKARSAGSSTPKQRSSSLGPMFLVLAAFSVTVMLMGLGATEVILRSFRNSVEENRDWANRVVAFRELDRLLQNIVDPALAVNKTGDPDHQRQELEKAANAMRVAISVRREEIAHLGRNPSMSSAQALLARVTDQMAQAISHSGSAISAYASGNREDAARHAEEAAVIANQTEPILADLHVVLSDRQQRRIDTQAERAATARRVLLPGLLAAALTLVGAAFFGRRLAGREETLVNERARLIATQQSEHELRTIARKLEESNRDLQDFAYVASHDLQEPLRKILAFGDRLKSKSANELSPESLDYLERMQSAAARMQRLIQDLLAFSRITTKGKQFVATNLDAVTREVVSDLEVAIAEAGATVELGDLPTLDADSTQMRQLLQNLVGNALKFRRPDVAPVITVAAKRIEFGSPEAPATPYQPSEGWWSLTVSDNGIGFDEKYLDRIFTVFQRLHSRNEYEGSGVGLAVCRRIVERHRGVISARSAEGQGATFSFVLPAVQHQTADLAAAEAAGVAAGMPRSLSATGQTATQTASQTASQTATQTATPPVAQPSTQPAMAH